MQLAKDLNKSSHRPFEELLPLLTRSARGIAIHARHPASPVHFDEFRLKVQLKGCLNFARVAYKPGIGLTDGAPDRGNARKIPIRIANNRYAVFRRQLEPHS